jgi:hypothetical protein
MASLTRRKHPLFAPVFPALKDRAKIITTLRVASYF